MHLITFPYVLGIIDVIHIIINSLAPHDHPELYVNSKNHYSIQLQVCLSTICF